MNLFFLFFFLFFFLNKKKLVPAGKVVRAPTRTISINILALMVS